MERPDIEHIITDHGLTESVRLFVFQDNPFPYMKVTDLLVCSSNYEGFSTDITESVILCKPVVMTDCSGMREIFEESEYGLITENSVEAFCEGVTKLLTDTSLRANYTVKASGIFLCRHWFNCRAILQNNPRNATIKLTYSVSVY